ncbi:MAG TPA: septal ring lytic transglycosylase RlpA family protein [Devosiaceae bacterium]|jgi:rare lipoprotein A|nr:septal ring lytic transglycosylase RlpA family protein [Devosiaceae bacterium]
MNRLSPVRLMVLGALLAPMVAACGGSGGGLGATVKRAAFTSKEYGVAVSPRVTRNPNPPRGGGRQMVGKPYTVRGKVYTPQANPQGYLAQGTASWYGSDFHGRRTANGEIFSANAITGAHPTLPLPSYVRVTNIDNGRSVMVRVNDRGPYIHGRIMDLSHRAADILGYVNRGMGNVQVQYVGPAPLEGDDTRMLLASINQATPLERGATRLAMVEQPAPTPSVHTMSVASIAQPATRSQGDYSSSDLATDVLGLFSYAERQEAQVAIDSAHAAVTAMASRDTGLREWSESVDEEARNIRLQIGTFRESARAAETATVFARLAAVTEEPVVIGGQMATRLVVTKLRPGVTRRDLLALAQELGLDDIVLY